MPPNRLLTITGISLLLLSLLAPVAAAQTAPTTVHITDVVGPVEIQGPGNLPAMSLQANFTMLDASGQVVRGVQIDTVSLALADGNEFPAQLEDIATPWSIVVLVDSSKTMAAFSAAATYKTARFAVADAVGQMPDGSTIAVMQFDNQPLMVQDFTKDKALAQDALRKKVKANSAGNACLNDAAFEAVNKLSAASGRRTLMIMTASLDNCGTRQEEEVTDLAVRNHIQIYAVGLRGYTVTGVEQLQNLTEPTHGIASLRLQDEIIFAFENLMNALNLQFQVKGNLYPKAGRQAATLTVTLKDGTILKAAPIEFDNDKDFARPAEVHFKSSVITTRAGLEFSLTFVSQNLIDKLTASIVNKRTAKSEADITLQEVKEDQKLNVSVLTPGEAYDLVITAFDANGNKLGSETAEFTYQPELAQLTITQVDAPNLDTPNPALVVGLKLTNLDDAKQFQFWVVPDGSEIPIPGTVQTVPVASQLRVPIGDLPTGAYEAVIQAQNQDGQVLATVTTPKFTFAQPTQLQRTLRYIRETPLAIAGITLVSGLTCVALLAVGWVAVGMMRPKTVGRTKAVDLALPEIKRRPPPVILESSAQRPVAREGPRPVERRPPERSYEREAERPARPVAAPGDGRPAPAGALPAACLSGHTPSDMRISANIRRVPFSIGRKEGNDLVVKVDNRMGVSGRHATITFENGQYYLVDEKSTYGTLLNDRRLAPNAPAPLEDGAVIGLGPRVKLEFRLTNCP